MPAQVSAAHNIGAASRIYSVFFANYESALNFRVCIVVIRDN